MGRKLISYAQNAEDIVLARVFSGTVTGRYVDIGAGDPVAASVTKLFYDKGWRGINVEPIPDMAARLRNSRPEDITLDVAIGAKPCRAVLHVVRQEWGWSTLDDELARTYQHSNNWQLGDVEVEVCTLDDILDKHPGHIDFLKIDVEGAERDVISGADWVLHRPRVVVVEATRPGSPEPAYQEWEHMLLDAGYRCALFDGLNRFYAQADDGEALARLAVPANVFDDYETYAARKEYGERVALAGYVRRLERSLREAQAARSTDAQYLKRLEGVVADAQQDASTKDRYVVALEQRIAELEAQRPGPGMLEQRRLEQDPPAQQRVAESAGNLRVESGSADHAETPGQFVDRINAAGGGYHRLALPEGHVIEGIYDMAKHLPHYHLPDRLDGVTVLDVGTASGFFAIECARRGADVTAIDVEDDRLLPEIIPVFGLDIRYDIKDLYTVDVAFGEFDLVVCGTLLLHLPDPLGALRALRRVTRHRLVLSTSAIPGSPGEPEPLCHFYGERAEDGDYWSYWGFSAAALERMLLAAGFSTIENVEHFPLAPEPGQAGAVAPQVVLSAYV
jgi:FkbM family methyltransferase